MMMLHQVSPKKIMLSEESLLISGTSSIIMVTYYGVISNLQEHGSMTSYDTVMHLFI